MVTGDSQAPPIPLWGAKSATPEKCFFTFLVGDTAVWDNHAARYVLSPLEILLCRAEESACPTAQALKSFSGCRKDC
jgi:hypothetical protein